VTRYDRRTRLLAASLSGVAGYVDAIGFVTLGGFFVSFMSGNTTRVAVGLAEGTSAGLTAAGLIGAFVLGVIAGSLLGRQAQANRRPAVLIFVAALLVLASTSGAQGAPFTAMVVVAIAMGAENTVFAEAGEVRIGLTYMTGALVKLGKGIATALVGGDRMAWAPYFLLWFGLLVGATTGALVYARVGLDALWAAALAMALLAIVAAKLGPDENGDGVRDKPGEPIRNS